MPNIVLTGPSNKKKLLSLVWYQLVDFSNCIHQDHFKLSLIAYICACELEQVAKSLTKSTHSDFTLTISRVFSACGCLPQSLLSQWLKEFKLFLKFCEASMAPSCCTLLGLLLLLILLDHTAQGLSYVRLLRTRPLRAPSASPPRRTARARCFPPRRKAKPPLVLCFAFSPHNPASDFAPPLYNRNQARSTPPRCSPGSSPPRTGPSASRA